MILVYAFLSNDCTELEQFTDFESAIADRQWPHLVEGDICQVNIKVHGSHMTIAIVVLT